MIHARKGFTLIELMVVVIIMGILASMSIPYYYKTLEVSKASDAMAIGHMLGNAYRMYLVDNPTMALSGTITNTCNTGACDVTSNNVCRIVRCNYVAAQDWTNASYTFTVGGGVAAGTRRRTGAAPGTNNSPYSSWGYNFDLSGTCSAVNGAPACSGF